MLILWMSSKVIRSILLNLFLQESHSKLSFSDGFMFRLKIAVPREMALYKKEVTTKGITKYRDTPESMLIERELILLPKLTVSLHT